jgi:cAMP-dependent protein kinase regulator
MVDKSEFQHYLKDTAGPIVQDMLSDLLDCKPANATRFLVRWLEARTEGALSSAEREELHRLRREAKVLKGIATAGSGSESSGEEEVMDEVKAVKIARKEVCSETFGAVNKFEAFAPRVIAKTPAQKAKILSKLSKVFLFSDLEAPGLEAVVQAMEERKVPAGEQVIQEGAEGDFLCVVDTGVLECCKGQAVLRTYGPGDYFGELALLYNRPRAASVLAKTASSLWFLDRTSFIHILRDAAVKRRERYDQLLKKIRIFAPLSPYQRAQLSDALKPVSFPEGVYVTRKGDWSSVLYIVESGSARVFGTLQGGSDSVLLRELGPGDSFGELMGGEMRENVQAGEALQCVVLDRDAVQRLLGPLETVLELRST